MLIFYTTKTWQAIVRRRRRFPALRKSGFECNELSSLAKIKIHDQLIQHDQMIKRLSEQKSPKSHEEEKQECSGSRGFSKTDSFMCFVAHVGPHHSFQFGTVRRLSDDVILRGCDAQEVQVLRARGAAPGFLRLIAVQHPDIILTQQRVLYRNKYTHETMRPLELDVERGNNEHKPQA